LTDVYRSLLDGIGVTYPQYLVLLALWERDEQTVKQVADVLHLDYGTVSPLLKRMEGAGLVRRHRQVRDERTVVVALTEKGRALRQRATHIPNAIGCAIDMDDTAARQLIGQLERITARAEETSRRERAG